MVGHWIRVMPWVWVCVLCVGLCRGVYGSCYGGSLVSWFHGLCCGVCVVGRWHRGHVVGVVGHRFRVMPWVSFLWLWVDFGGCGGGLILVVVVVGRVKWWLTGGGGCNCCLL